MQVSMSNRGSGTCPTYRVMPRGVASSASATFVLDPAVLGGLKPGTRFDFDIAPESGKAPAATPRPTITLMDADIAVISGTERK